MKERGARLVLGEWNMLEHTRGVESVASRINFAVEGGGARLGPLEMVWSLSDHSAIGGVVQVDALEAVADMREAIDWDAVVLTVTDEDEGCYGDLVGGSTYE